jgi:hypothetical protein
VSDKPAKVKILYVPIFENDDLVLQNLPPTASGQWARQLILRQLQIDAQMLHSFGESGVNGEVTREEVQRIIQDELEPILTKLDDSLDRVIDDKIATMQQAVMQAVQVSIQSALGEYAQKAPPKLKSEPEPEPIIEEPEEEIPAWRRALGNGLEG